MNDYKELTAIFYYNDFDLWRKECPFDLNIPDNQLAYIIFDGVLKNIVNKEALSSAILNSIQFTDVADNIWYRTKRQSIIDWLIKGTGLYRNHVENLTVGFSEINHIFTNAVKENHYILVNVCGKRIKHDEKIIGRIPSSDGLLETAFKLSAARFLSDGSNY